MTLPAAWPDNGWVEELQLKYEDILDYAQMLQDKVLEFSLEFSRYVQENKNTR